MALRASVWDEGNKFCLQTPFNVVLTRLFNRLPEVEALYRDETRIWYFEKKHESMVRSWLRTLGYMVTQIDLPIPIPADEDFAVLGLLPTAQWEVCEAAYKTLCKLNHPDMGGNLETMQQINMAWEKVKLTKGK